MGKIYCILDVEANQIKIGYSKRGGEDRLAQFRTGNPDRLVLLTEFDGTMSDERALHNLLSQYKNSRRAEWFDAECIGYLLQVLHGKSLVVPKLSAMKATENKLEISYQKLRQLSNFALAFSLLCATVASVIMVLFQATLITDVFVYRAAVFVSLMAVPSMLLSNYAINHFYDKAFPTHQQKLDI